MRLVLCHTCWSWVGSTGTTCQICHDPLNIACPDPPFSMLAEFFGQAIVRIANVRLEKSNLPSTGALIGTTSGLMFLPFLKSLADGSMAELSGGFRARKTWKWWSSAAPTDTTRTSAVAHSVESLPSTNEDLTAIFFNSPGSVFVEHGHIMRLHVRGRTLSVTRTRGTVLQFTLNSPAEHLAAAWQVLSERGNEWRAVLPPSWLR